MIKYKNKYRVESHRMPHWDYSNHGMQDYTSIAMFIEKGFRVLPTSWRNVDACGSLIRSSLKYDNGKMLGHLFTAWGRYRDPVNYAPMLAGVKSVDRLVDNLVDRVSKNGYLLLNVGPKPDGSIPDEALIINTPMNKPCKHAFVYKIVRQFN